VEDGQVDFRKIYNIAKSYAKKRGLERDAEDFAQDCCLYAHETGTAMIYVERRFVEYLRRNYGDTRTAGGRLRSAAELNGCEFVEGAHGGQSSDGLARLESRRLLGPLSRWERTIYVMHHKYGITHGEIGDIQGVSASRISQIMSSIQERIEQSTSGDKVEVLKFLENETDKQRERDEETKKVAG
jgi:DNA-directed RNA polymerase specialized sigma24 family protein